MRGDFVCRKRRGDHFDDFKTLRSPVVGVSGETPFSESWPEFDSTRLASQAAQSLSVYQQNCQAEQLQVSTWERGCGAFVGGMVFFTSGGRVQARAPWEVSRGGLCSLGWREARE